jgi:mRNA-degrading endonuclease toxin of MazEF toxin-antitoxin module
MCEQVRTISLGRLVASYGPLTTATMDRISDMVRIVLQL